MVNITLDDKGFAIISLGYLFHERGYHLAGATPFSPEINNNRFVGFQYDLIKIVVVNMLCHNVLSF